LVRKAGATDGKERGKKCTKKETTRRKSHGGVSAKAERNRKGGTTEKPHRANVSKKWHSAVVTVRACTEVGKKTLARGAEGGEATHR